MPDPSSRAARGSSGAAGSVSVRAESAARSLVDELRRAGDTLSVAESCTGGMLAAALTAIPGASDVFWGGMISYDDAAKTRLLGVRRDTLAEHGAVSEAVVIEMAEGVRARSDTTWSLAITGIAGPGGGTPDKPVGTVWIALAGPRTAAYRYSFSGDREAVRRASVRKALELLSANLGAAGAVREQS